MNIPEKILDSLTETQKTAVKKAQTPEELLAIARETGYELSEEQLNTMSGGGDWYECDEYDYCADQMCYPVM